MEQIRIVIIAVLVVLHAVFGIPPWLAPDGSPYLVRAASYSFFHASWWHLAVNCLACWTVFRPRYLCKPCRDLAVSFIIAVLVYPLSFRPVIGFSNVLYATLGLRTPPLRSKWWGKTEVLVFIAVTVGLAFVPRFSATTHIASFVLGMAVAGLRRFNQTITKDARRYL